MRHKNHSDLFVGALKDFSYAEKQILKSLPNMAEVATSGQLRPRVRRGCLKGNTMKTVVTLAAAAVLLSSAALAQSVGEKTGVNSTLGISPATADFVKEAAMSDMMEIESSKIAQQKGNADEKKFAGQMITDHTKTSSELKSMVSSGDVKAELPASLDSSSQSKLDKLRNAKPEDFAAQYDPMQVSAHKDAVSLFERYAKGGDNAKLKDWAGKTLPALQHHLEMAQDMDKHRK
jgi:putative membrane protein